MSEFILIKIPIAASQLNKSELQKRITVTDENGNPASQINLPESIFLERVESAALIWHKRNPECVTFYIFGIPFKI